LEVGILKKELDWSGDFTCRRSEARGEGRKEEWKYFHIRG